MSHFKCCKTKEFTNFICVYCLGVFHPSCFERKYYKVIQGNKVYCSTKCEEQDKNRNEKLMSQLEQKDRILRKKTEDYEKLEIDSERTIDELKELINELKNELREKENHYGRERRRTLDFEDEVFRNEEKFESDLKEKCAVINDLNHQMAELKNRNKILVENSINDLNKITVMEKQMDEWNIQNNEIMKRLEDMKEENIKLRKHIEELTATQEENIKLREHFTELKTIQINSNTGKPSGSNISSKNSSELTERECTGSLNQKRKILVVGDEDAKGMITLLKTFTDYKYDIHLIYERKPLITETVNNISVCAKKFGKEDFILFLWSANFSIQGRGIDGNLISKLTSSCQETNLILIGPPFHRERPILNRFIEEDCWTLSMLVAGTKKETHHFVPMPIITGHNGLLSYDQKENLIRHLTNNLIKKQFFRA